jgi:purine-binding chemotaxis protein CheW
MGKTIHGNQVLVFELGGYCCGAPLGEIQEVLPMCRLVQTIGQPAALAGFLNLRGEMAPLVLLDRLFGLEPTPLHLYSHIVVTRGSRPLALSVERALDVVAIDAGVPLEPPAGNVFGDCLEGVLRAGSREVNLLRLDQVLLAEERSKIAEFTRMATERSTHLTGSTN